MAKRIISVLLSMLLLLLCGCSSDSVTKAETSSTEPSGTFMENATDHGLIKTDADYSADSGNTSFHITDYDDKPQGDFIGVFYDDNFYGWVSQIRNEDEINSYIAQGEYIGGSKEKQIVYNGTSDELIDGADDWYPDSDLECNGLNAGTPLYRIDNYIIAVYNTPIEHETVVVHKTAGTQEQLALYVYGNIYRNSENN